MTDAAAEHLLPRPDRPQIGSPLQVRWRKWDGGPHWVNDCIYLGLAVEMDSQMVTADAVFSKAAARTKWAAHVALLSASA